MRIHNKPAGQWRGRPETLAPAEEKVISKKRKRNAYASITNKLKRRLRFGLKDWYYKLVILFPKDYVQTPPENNNNDMYADQQ